MLRDCVKVLALVCLPAALTVTLVPRASAQRTWTVRRTVAMYRFPVPDGQIFYEERTDRGQDFAAGIWVIDAVFMLDLVHEQLNDGDTRPAREEAYFAGARINDDELRDDDHDHPVEHELQRDRPDRRREIRDPEQMRKQSEDDGRRTE